MNIPSINPTLTLTTPEGKIVDQVFTYIPMTDVPFYNCDVYIDEVWQNKASLNEMSLEEARLWWNTLVKKGYNRKKGYTRKKGYKNELWAGSQED